ncbi:MAG: hypothetical protein H3C47_02565 [Candidatus Cloacimonetes bacterium]|nr:hypothetical protein [Candidatus Cloacimonadota bacterium]
MSLKFTEEQLMDFLFGEADSSLNGQILMAIQTDTVLKAELESMQKLLGVMGIWEMEEASSPQEEILDLCQISQFLKLSEQEISLNLKEIPHMVIAGQIRFSLPEIRQWLKGRSSQRKTSDSRVIEFDDFLKRRVI